MSMNRDANLTKLRWVLAPNVSQKVPSTSNATKPNKAGANRRMILVDEDDDEDEEIFQGIILLILNFIQSKVPFVFYALRR
ncbi:hypothetical protein HanPSC8_Chr11g0461351 [Helianthus annuus]|nr:hypothetical protein HanPSC8_Chr11g0461351 [Helianthus annuus]